MRNTDGQVYCVGCESWVYPNQLSPKKQRFGELVSLKGKQNMKLKNDKSDLQLKNDHTDLAKVYPGSYFNVGNNVRGILERKLVYLANLLDKETDPIKIK